MRRATLTALLGAFLLPGARAADDPAKAPLTADTIWRIKLLAAPAISPDGAWAVVPVTTFDMKEDKGLTDLWLVPTTGAAARRLTTPRGAGNPAWSPDGKWIAFESKRGSDEQAQICVIPDRRRRSAARHQRPDRGRRAEVVPRLEADRVPQPRLADLDLGRPGETAQGAQGLEDDRAGLRPAAGAPLGPLARRARDPRLRDRRRRRRARRSRSDRGRPVARRAGADSYDIAPDGKEIAFAADADPTGVDAPRHLCGRGRGRGGPEDPTDNTPTTDRCTAPTGATSPTAAR